MTTEPLEQGEAAVANGVKAPVLAALPDEHAVTSGPRQPSIGVVGVVDDDPEGRDKMDVDSAAMQAIPLPEGEEVKETFYELRMGWSGKVYEMTVGANDLVFDFREKIFTLTEVPAERQKLIGLTKGKLAAEHDASRFGTLGIKSGIKFTMIGTPVKDSFKDPKDVRNLGEINDDFDVSYPSEGIANQLTPAEDPRNKRKIRDLVRKYPITLMNEPREGKRLLVLDIDYTIIDTRPLIDGQLPPMECIRPGLHEFLEEVYPYYDIAIWSHTHWRWLETKLVEIGMIGGERPYKVCFVSDASTMFPIFSQRNGQAVKHHVKPLEYFWATQPHWSAKNTIHIDDLSRNFALNPGEGLKIRAFKGAGTPDGMRDRELPRLSRYLVGLAERDVDFTQVDHARWKEHVRNPPPL